MDQHFDTGIGSEIERAREGRIEIAASRKGFTIFPLDDEQGHGPVARGDLRGQLLEVAGGAGGGAVGKLGEARRTHQLDVLRFPGT